MVIIRVANYNFREYYSLESYYKFINEKERNEPGVEFLAPETMDLK